MPVSRFRDLGSLVPEEAEVAWHGKNYRFRFVPVVLKGDWVWLRASMHLCTGFSSRRKCHICPFDVSWILLEDTFGIICTCIYVKHTQNSCK